MNSISFKGMKKVKSTMPEIYFLDLFEKDGSINLNFNFKFYRNKNSFSKHETFIFKTIFNSNYPRKRKKIIKKLFQIYSAMPLDYKYRGEFFNKLSKLEL